ncbi:MAG: replication-associated recombination protein A [Bacteroidetes bacterium]|nr:replication-associated recombination protein A [Bacteroidota bacterium]
MDARLPEIPLAERMRPRTLEEYVGQKHLIGEGKPVFQMLNRGVLFSMVFWGPPGSGKTTLARLLSSRIEAHFEQISAVSSGVKDVRLIIENARKRRLELSQLQTVLFIDEIHRFNKAQQDALLQAVEQGDIILIGATTENPSFEIIPPLRSRARTYVLNPLTIEELSVLLDRALEKDEYLRRLSVSFEDRDMLIAYSGGDARSMLNGLEMCCLLAEEDGAVHITQTVLEEAFQRAFAKYDKGGEEHYNVISAFIKSVRGSDPDAALYWMARMLQGGEDPLFVARRLIILASEDIGNAEPNALLLATACYDAVHAIGMPEARIVLAQTVTYLASAPKSNAAYLAIGLAYQDVGSLPPYSVPLHLRNAPTGLMKSQGYGKGYKYSHDFPGHFVEQDYLPEELRQRQYYKPGTEGREGRILERLRTLWKRRSY